ncbi:hypothetical protein ACFW6R_25690 [Streptomyces albidoflavus]
MPSPEPAKVPLTVTLSPAAARALFEHEPSEELLEAALRRIAARAEPASAHLVSYTASVDPRLLGAAQRAAAAQGIPLNEAIEATLLPRPVVLQPARIARLLGVGNPTLNRALANDPAAPDPANPHADGKPRYDVREVLDWWPDRRRAGSPPTARCDNCRNRDRSHLAVDSKGVSGWVCAACFRKPAERLSFA